MKPAKTPLGIFSAACSLLLLTGLAAVDSANATPAVETALYKPLALNASGCTVVAEGKNAASSGALPAWVFHVSMAGRCPFLGVTHEVCLDSNAGDSVVNGFVATCTVNTGATFVAQGVGPLYSGFSTPSVLTVNTGFEVGFGCTALAVGAGAPATNLVCPYTAGTVSWSV